jgi:predicted transcriptional regulator
MQDDCLLELHEVLQPEARQVFVILIAMGSANREQLMQVGQLTTQRVRKAIWGLANTGLIVQKRQEPLRLSPSGERLAELLRTQADRDQLSE